VAALVTDLMQFQTIKALRQELENSKQQAAQVASLQDELARMKEEAATASAAQAADVQVRELARLRGQVAMMRTQTNELTKARQEIATLRLKVLDEASAREAEGAARQTALAASEAQAAQKQADDACINNLRLIDAAKQQWALEFKKLPTDIPSVEDIQPYMGRGAKGEMPTCPDGGTYTLGAVNEKPTCSVPSHTLP
jgi:hypothetical protein